MIADERDYAEEQYNADLLHNPDPPLTDDELDELEASDVDDELDAAGYFECSCGSVIGVCSRSRRLRDPDCPLHGDGH